MKNVMKTDVKYSVGNHACLLHSKKDFWHIPQGRSG